MANEKMLNTRIQLKYDSYDKWEASTVVLKPGEIAIAYLTTDYAVAPGETDFQKPVLFKVGDDIHTFSELPWASALAADVYEWAKQTENDFVNTFLALKMNDGTTMQAKLDTVFATDQELTEAINELRLEIPTSLGVMSVDKEDGTAIKVDNTDPSNPLIGFLIDTTDNKGNVELTQSDNGLKANVDLSDYALKDEIPSISPIVIVDDTEVEEPTSEFVNVYKNLIASGHTLTEELVQIPTKLYVDNKITGAVDYLGTVDSAEALKALNPQNKGDFARVSVSFGDYHASDMLICETLKSEGVDATWSVIHGEIDANDWVANAQGAAGYVAIPVADRVWGADDKGNPSWMQVQTAQIADKAVTEEKLADEVVNKLNKAVNDGKLSVTAVDATVLSVTTDKQFSANTADDTSITLDIAEKGVQNKHIADKTISAEKTKAYVANAGETSEEVWVFYCGTSDILVD